MNDADDPDRINAGEYTAEEDLEDRVALARHRARNGRGEVAYVPHTEARHRLGLDSTT